ncbi:unnamed protein product [Arabidopsis arenosa]|uniref:Uncharacterized protein n=1 Tax=Arabidopsis arenosa TaxID=38785 RepID=A0A8S1ZQ35_ARAAE|nr:unnamed protein product [Arabidopsis arenosa]
MVRRSLMALLKMCGGHSCSGGEISAEDGGDDGDRGIFFSLQELEVATDFFSEKNLLGTGGFGPVYKGSMPNGEEIAVKKLSVDSRQGSREFTNEIVSGRKNQNPRLGPEMADLLSYAWKMYQEGKILELMDQSLAGVYNRDEAATCFIIGLLCCQQITSNRPDINMVHQMLSSDSFDLPKPGRPGLQGRRGGGYTSTGAGTGAGSRTFGLNGSEPNSFKSRRSSGGGAAGQDSIVEEYSRNSISMSSFGEGR